MKTVNHAIRMICYWLVLVSGILGAVPLAFAQGTEEEPNNTCQSAQDFGQNTLPFVVDGNLNPTDATPGAPGDVDFYRFSATPGTILKVDLEGQATGKGTLYDPFLGYFDSACNLVTYNDDVGQNSNPRLTITVPTDGILVLAAQSCCDTGFSGGGEGTYQLTLSPFAAIDSIHGQVVDAESGIPLTGDYPYYTSVWLLQCSTSFCDSVSYVATASDGAFVFTQDFSGQPLEAGSYLIIAYAQGYPQYQSDRFDVSEGQDHDLGTIPLTAYPSIGSISGRVVDAISGVPLSGQDFPYSIVDLYRCETVDFCNFMSSTNVDGTGRFLFVNSYPAQLPPGNYEVRAYAQDYQEGRKVALDVKDGEDRDIGDVALEPYPIHFSEIRPCGNLPETGGTCHYSVRVTNRSQKQLIGATWSLVNAYNTGSLAGNTAFQTANPVKMTLAPGASRVVDFQFDVPANVANGANICADAWVGENKNQSFFNTLAVKGLLCISKVNTGFTLLSKKETQELSRQSHQPSQRLPRQN